MNTDNERRIRNSRSKLYERYNVNVQNNNKPSSSSGRRRNRHGHHKRDHERNATAEDEQHKDRTMQKLRLVAFALIIFTLYTRVSTKSSKEEEYETISVLRSTTDESSFIDIDPAEPEVSGLKSYASDNNNIIIMMMS